MANTQFGNYRVERQLGPGGAYGVAYLVSDKDNNQGVLKWLKPEAPREGRARFENEVWALKKLAHPYLPKFVDRGEAEGRPYIVMSFAKGETLRTLLEINRREGGVLSQLKVVLIAEALLAVLAYMHEQGVVHRDVKDDNVVVVPSGSDVTLIDLGVCKGDGQPEEGQTFWNAGASRFSPPSKLEHPTSHNPKHDVFAVGVLCYLMLTNDFPWQVAVGADSGHLRELMLNVTPTAVRDQNRFVDRSFSDFVSDLIDTRDHHRPTASEALSRVRIVRQQLESRSPSVLSEIGSIKFPRVIRDALHGDIPLTSVESQIISSKEFQTLRHIHQLGLSYLVFPGAEHSRFTHAIGTMHVADKILTRIETRTGSLFDSDERLMIRTFALVHDIAHIAFGHTLEDELNFFPRHDQNDRRITRLLSSTNSEVGSVLESTEYGRAVMDVLAVGLSESNNSWIAGIVSDPSGADVLDYVDRDALFCGLDHRIDSAIFRQFVIEKRNRGQVNQRQLVSKLYGRHGFRIDAEYALLSLLRERFALFLKVYTHPTKIAAGAMLGKALFESRLNEIDVEGLGDYELLFKLKASDVTIVKRLTDALLTRKLYTPSFRARALSSDQRTREQYRLRQEALDGLGVFTPAGRAELENEFAVRASISSNDIIVYASRNAPGAQKIQQHVEVAFGKRRVRDEIHRPHQEIFRDHLSLWNVYVFMNPELQEDKKLRVAEDAEEIFGLKNEILTDRRQLVFDL